MCLSSHFFLFPNSQLIPTCAKHCVFTGRCACLSRPIFSYSLIQDLFVWRGPANGFCNLNSMRQLLIKNRKYFSLKKKQQVTNDIIHWQGHVKRISPELGNRKKMGRERHAHLPVKTQCFAHVGISCELGNRKKRDERHMQHLPVKTQCFLQFGKGCELGNRKKWDGKHKGCTYLWKHNVLCT